ncbi:MAG: 3-oxoacyl-[acyl-carrier-protein] reductase [Nitrospinota bacterium]|nr:3-oxoacyl-[acyl-carrier-protein] reductase [Nitrospinota bacterium]
MITGKTALITGASRGIGREIAATFAEAGANLFLAYQSTPMDETLKLVAERKNGCKVETFKGDVSDSGVADAAVKECVEKFGTIDILVNNAGVTRDGLLIRMKDSDWDDVININLKGAFNLVRAVSKIMLKKRTGKIINIGSVVGSMGNAGQVNYSASKAGLEGLTKSVARELASRNIQANLIAPGYISTDMTDKLDDKARDAILGGIPAGKLGKPEDVAKAALFLASEASDYITGNVLHVNGGMYM